MIVAVTGGRDYADSATLRRVLEEQHQKHYFHVLIHGCAQGADTMAASWAMEHGVHPAGIPALWDFYGKTTAGPVRNGAIIRLKPQLLIAFPGGRGTANCVGQAQQAGIPVVFAANQDLVS